MRRVEFDFEDKDECEEKLVNEIELDDYDRLRKALIRDVKIRRVENISERVDAI
jgi:hypothetical protein